MRMKFFISAEIYKDAAETFRATRAEVERTLNSSLEGESYGSCLEEIGIIPIVLPAEFLLGRNERRLFQRKSKSADYRLVIDYNKFQVADVRTKELLLINNRHYRK